MAEVQNKENDNRDVRSNKLGNVEMTREKYGEPVGDADEAEHKERGIGGVGLAWTLERQLVAQPVKVDGSSETLCGLAARHIARN